MKRKFLLSLLILSVFGISVKAQKAAFRINNGFSASFLNPDKSDNVYPYYFYTGGIGVDYAILKYFYMQTELAYLRSGNRMDFLPEQKDKINYFDNITLNTSFNIQIPITFVKPVIGVGVYGIAVVNDGVKYVDNAAPNEDKSQYHNDYRKWNVGAVGNAGLLLDFGGVDLGFRYTVHVPFLTAFKETSKARNYVHTLYFTISARF